MSLADGRSRLAILAINRKLLARVGFCLPRRIGPLSRKDNDKDAWISYLIQVVTVVVGSFLYSRIRRLRDRHGPTALSRMDRTTSRRKRSRTPGHHSTGARSERIACACANVDQPDNRLSRPVKRCSSGSSHAAFAGTAAVAGASQAIANRWIGSPHGLVYDNGLVFGNGPDDKNRVAWR